MTKRLRLLAVLLLGILPLLACSGGNIGRPTAKARATTPAPRATATEEVESPGGADEGEEEEEEGGEGETEDEWYDDSYAGGGAAGDDRVEFEGISFGREPELGTVEAEIVPEAAPDENDPLLEVYPEHIRFTFADYPAPAGHMFAAQIFVYPVAAYEALLPDLKSDFADFAGELKKQPREPKHTLFLPRWNAGQIFRARVEYLDFGNGTMVCMLNQWGQAASAINRQSLFYTCRGLTLEGDYYIAAIFPVDAPGIGSGYDDFGDYDVDYTAADFDTQYSKYLESMAAHLEKLTPEDFTPNLDTLAGVMMSLSVDVAD